MQIGQLCYKIAGRDSGKVCVVVDVLEKNYVLIDGQTRRKKCNLSHLEPLEKRIELSKGASHDVVVKAFDKLGLKARTTKPKKVAPRQKKAHKVKQKPAKTAKKQAKKEVKKEEPKAEATKKKPVKKKAVKKKAVKKPAKKSE